MKIKEKIETLHKIKKDYIVDYDNAKYENNTNFIESYLKPRINDIVREINQLEDLWLDGVKNV